MDRLKNRSDFLRAARGIRRVSPGLTLEISENPTDGATRVGFTASRKIGNAVIRNRAKRRLRAAARVILAGASRPGVDYVLVARAGTVTRPFQSLAGDLAEAVRLAHVKLDQSKGART
ncbi:MAG: ribonuclease P protein component [Proteobacteria bacterium]|nr:ribonuclease P protein component [Pseudomonadota bacterium]